jgi:hypothetical protein
MEHETSPVFDAHDPSRETLREVVSAWVVIIILLVVTSVAFFLDHAATMEP